MPVTPGITCPFVEGHSSQLAEEFPPRDDVLVRWVGRRESGWRSCLSSQPTSARVLHSGDKPLRRLAEHYVDASHGGKRHSLEFLWSLIGVVSENGTKAR